MKSTTCGIIDFRIVLTLSRCESGRGPVLMICGTLKEGDAGKGVMFAIVDLKRGGKAHW
jgi:hypothetical protein